MVLAWAGAAAAADVMDGQRIERYQAPATLAPSSTFTPSSFAPISTAVFFGASLKADSVFGNAGFVRAANGDLAQDGWLYRAGVGLGQYDYKTASVPTGEVDAERIQVDLALGYQWHLPTVRFALFGGVDFADRDLSPADPLNSTGGADLGAKVQGELETLPDTPYYGSAVASYSTANDDYTSRLRLGARYGELIVGPELGFQGDDVYDETRYGVFLKGFRLGALESEVFLGYADTTGLADHSRFYVGAGFSFGF
jgi:hypothetical protein